MVKEFEDQNVPKLIDVLSIADNFFSTLTVGGLQDILTKNRHSKRKYFIFI